MSQPILLFTFAANGDSPVYRSKQETADQRGILFSIHAPLTATFGGGTLTLKGGATNVIADMIPIPDMTYTAPFFEYHDVIPGNFYAFTLTGSTTPSIPISITGFDVDVLP